MTLLSDLILFLSLYNIGCSSCCRCCKRNRGGKNMVVEMTSVSPVPHVKRASLQNAQPGYPLFSPPAKRLIVTFDNPVFFKSPSPLNSTIDRQSIAWSIKTENISNVIEDIPNLTKSDCAQSSNSSDQSIIGAESDGEIAHTKQRNDHTLDFRQIWRRNTSSIAISRLNINL